MEKAQEERGEGGTRAQGVGDERVVDGLTPMLGCPFMRQLLPLSAASPPHRMPSQGTSMAWYPVTRCSLAWLSLYGLLDCAQMLYSWFSVASQAAGCM